MEQKQAFGNTPIHGKIKQTEHATPDPSAGPLQDYYAWKWGDALFVVLDPFWFAPRQRGGGDNWTRTLGAEQYQWLRRMLQQSRAKFKFVCIHHLVGGADKQSRGGAEAAPFYEWGGKNADGSEGFQQHRPGWPAPIHQLLVETGVSIVFHGHDHLFAKQDLDGIVYQEVPQPGLRRYNTPRTAAKYGYVQGAILGGPGHLRIAVSPDQVAVDFVNSCLPEDETATARTGRSVSAIASPDRLSWSARDLSPLSFLLCQSHGSPGARERDKKKATTSRAHSKGCGLPPRQEKSAPAGKLSGAVFGFHLSAPPQADHRTHGTRHLKQAGEPR